MDNKELYKKTLTFSIRKLLVDLLTLLVVIGLAALGFVIMNKINNMGLVGLLIGLVLGIIVAALVGRFVSYTYKASQIAMMTYGIVENKLPDNVYKEGRKIVKERFATVAALFAITGAIKGIFNQIGRGITNIGQAVGGDTGGAVGSAVSSAIQTVIAYMCDCCLGWVFFRTDKGTVRATLEGAVLFFKHGKTLIKNVGRIFGMGFVSFLAIGGPFFGISYLIFSNMPTAFNALSAELVRITANSDTQIPAFFTQGAGLVILAAAIVAICIWSFAHSAFIRPFVLVGVLRNYLEAGMKDMPNEKSFAEIAAKSPKFAQLQQKLGQEA